MPYRTASPGSEAGTAHNAHIMPACMFLFSLSSYCMQHTTTRWPRKSVLYVKLSSTCRLDAKRWKPLLRSICINATYPSAAVTYLRAWLPHDVIHKGALKTRAFASIYGCQKYEFAAEKPKKACQPHTKATASTASAYDHSKGARYVSQGSAAVACAYRGLGSC
jgi:hypothetical protein